MRKLLLFIMCVAASVATQALPTLTNSWMKSQSGILPIDNVNSSNPVALSAQGEMYVTGLFAEETFSFAGKDLEPIAVSSYLLKYAADGTEKWGIALAGAATITAITTDDAGNVYIAGNLADKVQFGSTDGSNIEKEGLKNPDDGSYYTEQGAGFVAKYDMNGVLKGVQTFLPEGHPELLQTFAYFPGNGDLRFNINQLICVDGKLYASAIYTGLTQSNGYSFKGNYYDLDGGGFYYGDLAAGGIFSMNGQLVVDGIIASMRMTNANNTALATIQSVSFGLSEGKLYSGFVATGNETLTIGSQEQNFELTMLAEGDVEYGHILSVIDLSNGTSSLTKKYSTTHDDTGNFCTIKSMVAKDDVLLIGGTFNTKLAFDATKITTSTDDLYLAVLNATTLEVNNTAISGINEELKKKEEVFKGMAIIGDYAYLVGYLADLGTHAAETPLAFWINIADGTLTSSNPTNLNTGVAALGTKLATAQTKIEGGKLVNIFSMDVVSNASSVTTIRQDAGIAIYPNPVVNELYFTAPCNVTVINLIGMVVKQAENVSSINVSDLTYGQYIVKVTTENGTSTFKVIKK